MGSESKDIKLVKVGTRNFDELIDLAPDKSQYAFVADNAYSLAEAYANIMDGKLADDCELVKSGFGC